MLFIWKSNNAITQYIIISYNRFVKDLIIWKFMKREVNILTWWQIWQGCTIRPKSLFLGIKCLLHLKAILLYWLKKDLKPLLTKLVCTPKLRYNERSCQAPFVHYIAKFTISWLFNSKGSWHLFTISRNSLYRDSLYRSLGVLPYVMYSVLGLKKSWVIRKFRPRVTQHKSLVYLEL